MGFFKEKKDIVNDEAMDTPRSQILYVPTPDEGSETEKLEPKTPQYDKPKEGKENEKEAEEKKQNEGKEKLENRKPNLEQGENSDNKEMHQEDKGNEFKDRLKEGTPSRQEQAQFSKDWKEKQEKNASGNSEADGAPNKGQRELFIANESPVRSDIKSDFEKNNQDGEER